MTDSLELELRNGFLDEAKELLSGTEQCFLNLEKAAGDPTVLGKIFRLAHNLKGSAGAVGFARLAEFTHHLESFILKIKNGQMVITPEVITLLLACNDHLAETIEKLRRIPDSECDHSELTSRIAACGSAPAPPLSPVLDVASTPDQGPDESEALAPLEVLAPPEAGISESGGPQCRTPTPAASADENIRVSLGRISRLMNNVGELVILQTVLNQQKAWIQSPLVQNTVTQMSKIIREVQEISMSLRLVPLKQTFQKMQRIVRDTSSSVSKKVDLVVSGEETEVDKTILENLGDPLVHLIRNAVDHGIEDPQVRARAGKPETGIVRLSAYQRSGSLVIEVADDGEGLDARKLREKAVEKGIVPPLATLSDKECHQLIFKPGFSTKAVVTDVSGRGVGMDVVKTNIEKLQGEIQIETRQGLGTTFKIKLPLTLAIIDAMIVRCNSERYIIPLGHVHESLRPMPQDIHSVSGVGQILSLRKQNMPLYSLQELLGRSRPQGLGPESAAVVISVREKPFAILVDEILGQYQVVVKQLGQDQQGLRGFSGGAILGDGRPALILELAELIARPSRPTRSSSGLSRSIA